MKKSSKDLTTGSITKNLLLFALPILLGQVLQNLYHSVDSIVVGQALGKTALGFLQDLMGRAVVDVDTLGADNVKLLMNKVFSRDVEGFLTGEDRTSLTRQFATTVLMKKTNTSEKREVEYLSFMNGDYNTGTLVDIANLALEGKVATKADIDRLVKIIKEVCA